MRSPSRVVYAALHTAGARRITGAMPREYFFISDMHIGGDGALHNIDFEDELIEFLKSLEHEQDAELIINGDAFGLWEFTTLVGAEKLEALIEQQSRLFEQLKRTGSKVPITLMPGNHDYELACYPEFIDRLREYNLNLVPEVSMTREVAGRKIWIEHGQQHDERNHMPDFGNPYAQPVGYFITTGIVGTAGRYSEFGRGNWLKDVQAVNPILDNPLTDSLGIPGKVVRTVLILEGVLALLLLLALVPAAIPLGILLRDLRRTLGRYHILMPKTPAQIGDGPYLEAARQVFEQDPSVAVFVYGHTHLASLKEVDDKVVINTGTWLKMPKKVPVLFGQLPPVYIPAFRLNYFRIAEEDGQLAIFYEQIEKRPPSELTWSQRLLTLARRPAAGPPIPKRTIVGA